MHIARFIHACVLACLLGAVGDRSATAQDSVAKFYEGKTIELEVSAPAGSGIDVLARAVAAHLGNHIAGKPRIIVRNMPGGGGVLMARHLYTSARKDGTELGAAEGGLILNPLFGINPGNIDMTRFGWLGSVSQDTAIAVVSTVSGIASIEDAKTRDVVVGATGAAGTSGQWAPLANATLGTRFKNVFGYPGTTEMNLALERGEIECRLATYTALLTQKPEWFRDGKIKVILQMGSVRNPALADVPVFEDLVRSDEDRAMVRLVSATFELNRPYMAPPGVPPERLGALRAAFDAMAKDPAFVADGNKVTNVAPSTGVELDRAIARVYATPPSIVERVLALSRSQEELERLQREDKTRGGR